MKIKWKNDLIFIIIIVMFTFGFVYLIEAVNILPWLLRVYVYSAYAIGIAAWIYFNEMNKLDEGEEE